VNRAVVGDLEQPDPLCLVERPDQFDSCP
jgi:hypothetical protein